MQTNYADTILNISVTGPMVRIDLGTVNPIQNPEGKVDQNPRLTQQLVMPLEGFARSFGIQEQVMKKLLEDGVLKTEKREASGQA